MKLTERGFFKRTSTFVVDGKKVKTLTAGYEGKDKLYEVRITKGGKTYYTNMVPSSKTAMHKEIEKKFKI